jgi:hypothetical protein
MAKSFDKETPVLLYGTQRGSKGPWAHGDPGPPNEREWLLWPAWAFRVVAPEFRDRRINALQLAVLGILRGSRLTAVEIAQRLGIHPELAAFVVIELQTQSRVDTKWNVTKAGVELLDVEQEGFAQLVPGWVFRDPWTGNLWPFIASSLEYARTERSEDGYPVLELGTTGRPWHQAAWMMFPPADSEPTPPDAREVLRAAAESRRLFRRSAQQQVMLEDADEAPLELTHCDLDRVTSIESEPESVFLVTYLYVPRDVCESGIDWHACDFFGRGSSPTLRRLITKVASNDEGMARILDRFLGRTIYGGLEEFMRTTAMREQRARLLLEHALTIDIHHHGVSEPLAEALASWLEVKELGDAAEIWRRRGVLTTCRRALERLFRDMARTWCLAGVADRLSRDPEVNRARLHEAAALVGFPEVPDGLMRVTQGQVLSVANYENAWRLQPLVMATLLRAVDITAHPLHSAAKRAPDLLVRIARVAAQAGEAAHDADKPQFELGVIESCVTETFEITGVILGLPMRTIQEGTRDE